MPIGSCEVKFKLGDIVQLSDRTPIYNSLESPESIGLVVSEPILMYVHDWETEDVVREFWCYEVLINGRRYKNLPEEALKRVEKNEDEKNIE